MVAAFFILFRYICNNVFDFLRYEQTREDLPGTPHWF
jgi:hypothetical protein